VRVLSAKICPPLKSSKKHDGLGVGGSFAIKTEERLHYIFSINLMHGHYLMFF
jgi:hypothetical protein